MRMQYNRLRGSGLDAGSPLTALISVRAGKASILVGLLTQKVATAWKYKPQAAAMNSGRRCMAWSTAHNQGFREDVGAAKDHPMPEEILAHDAHFAEGIAENTAPKDETMLRRAAGCR